jgi:hypothetical protein
MVKFRQPIRKGNVGSDVLAVKGPFRRVFGGHKVDFSRKAGDAFVRVVKAIEAKHGLKVDGVYGPKVHTIVASHFRPYEAWLYNQAKIRQAPVTNWVIMAQGADRPGVPTHQVVKDFVAKVAKQYGKPLVIGTGTNHNQYVKGTHNQSDHWTGHAADLPMTGSELTKLGRAALVAAGMPAWQAAFARGGIYNFPNRKQVIFNTFQGGNHWNHCHVSAY